MVGSGAGWFFQVQQSAPIHFFNSRTMLQVILERINDLEEEPALEVKPEHGNYLYLVSANYTILKVAGHSFRIANDKGGISIQEVTNCESHGQTTD